MNKHDNTYESWESSHTTGWFGSLRNRIIAALLVVALTAAGVGFWQTMPHGETAQEDPAQEGVLSTIPARPQPVRERVSISYRVVAGPLMCEDDNFNVEDGEEINVSALNFEGYVCITPDFVTVAENGYDYGYTFFYVLEEDLGDFIDENGRMRSNPLLDPGYNGDTTVLGLTPLES